MAPRGNNPDNRPKWAQRMESLQRQAAELRRENDRLHAAFAGNGSSPFKIVNGLRKDDLPLPEGTRRIAWQSEDFELEMYEGDGYLRILCTSWHGIAIQPEASNVVRIGRGRTR